MKRFALALLSSSLLGAGWTALGIAQTPGEDEATPTVDALMACRTIEDLEARVACFDERIVAFSAALEDGSLVVVERAAIRAVEREGFGIALPSMSGLRSLFGGSDQGDAATPAEGQVEVFEDGSEVVYASGGGIEEIRSLPVRSVTTNNAGDLVITLENGQVWLQADSTQIRAPRRNEMDGLTATIQDGALSSFFMELSYSSRRFRVRRLR
jgi:hypothetical protein